MKVKSGEEEVREKESVVYDDEHFPFAGLFTGTSKARGQIKVRERDRRKKWLKRRRVSLVMVYPIECHKPLFKPASLSKKRRRKHLQGVLT